MANLTATTSYYCQGTQGYLRLDSITPPAGATDPIVYSWSVHNTDSGLDYGSQGLNISQLPLAVQVPDGPYTVLVLAEDGAHQQYASEGMVYEVDCAGGGGPGNPGGGSPVTGCQDEYADNYDPAATQAGSCSYSVNWRSAWGPLGVAVRVAAVAGQMEAFVVATLRTGFRNGHPLASERPLADVATLRATVGPDGYATFVLGPYLRPLLGAPDGAGGYRYDLNSETVDDLYVGYELRRTTGELLEHGYVVNAAVPDSYLAAGFVLSAFAPVPTWPGFSWKRAELAGARFGTVNELYPASVSLPCPPNPLPVAWLNPQGGWDFWCFQGKTQLSDVVGPGQQYTEAGSGELRYSERGQSRRSYQARSGVFKGPGLAEGLATLWRSPQVWLQPVAGGEWVPVTIDAGSYPVRRVGVLRNEFTITFQDAAAQYAQGQ